jgi:hypothetical protein
MAIIIVKIIGYKNPQRYSVKRAVISANIELQKTYPDLEINIVEIKSLTEIQKITQAFMLPSLMIEDKLVCVERFPKKAEIIDWLRQTLESILKGEEND